MPLVPGDPGFQLFMKSVEQMVEDRSVDTRRSLPDDKPMAEITREELNAKLETIETRMDARVAAIEGKIDSFMARLDERFLRTDERMARIETDLAGNKAEIAGWRQEFRSLKVTTITTGIGAVLAIIFGVAAFNATVLSNMLASFESGKNTSAAQAEIKRQSEETGTLLKQLQQAYPPPTTPTAPK